MIKEMFKKLQLNESLVIFLLSIFYTLFAIFIYPTYNVEKEDQIFYTPPILQKIDENILKNDFLLQKPQTDFTLYDELIAFFANDVDDLYKVYFWGTVISFLFLFTGIILISYGLTKNYYFSLFIPFIFLLAHAGGVCNAVFTYDWMFSFEQEIHARSLATALSILVLGLFLNKNYISSFFLSGIAILIHVITILPLLFFMFLYKIYSEFLSQKNYKFFLYFLLPFFGILTLLIFSKGGGESSKFFQFMDSEWETFSRNRSNYLFMFNWFDQIENWRKVLFPLFCFSGISLLSPHLSKKVKKIFLFFWVMFLIFIILYAIGFEYLKLVLLLQFQFLRFIIWLKILSIILFFWHGINELKELKKINYYQFLLIIGLVGSLLDFDSLLPIYFLLLLIKLPILTFKNFLKSFSGKILLTFILTFSILKYSSFVDFLKGLLFYSKGTVDEFVFNGILLELLNNLNRVTLVLLIILFLHFVLFKKLKNKKLLFISFFILISIFSYQVYSPSNFSYEDEDCLNFEKEKSFIPIKNYMDQFYKKEILLITSLKKEKSQCLRRQLNWSLFWTPVEGAQGNFDRSYAMECLKRKDIVKNLSHNLNVLEQDYPEVKYLILSKKEDFEGWQLAVESNPYYLYKKEED